MTKLTVTNPYDLSEIETINLVDNQALEATLQTAYTTFHDRDNWLKPYQRIAILEKTLKIMQALQPQLAIAAAAEGGKPLIDSNVEVERAIDGVKIAIEQIRQQSGTEIPMNITKSSTNRLAYTFREPKGVVLAISAFNHPLNLAVHQIIPAIATGCPVLFKPASTTPLAGRNLINILYQAGLPPKWCQFIPCNSETIEPFVSDPRISFLSFIGSYQVGWKLHALLPPGASCALEHGGAAPVIVEPDADLQEAMPLLTKGGFYHAGQVCVSVQRIFVHEDIIVKLSKGMTELAEKLIVGDPTDINTEIGPLISPEEVRRIDTWVQNAITKGATLLCGGKRISETCYSPTILLNPPEDCEVSTQEIFGPVVCIYAYTDIKDAIDRANSLNYCFQASVFTKNIDIALDCVKRLEATAVMINDHTAFRADWMPFGGRKNSGLNVGGIPYSMQDMTYEKLMILKSKMLS